MGEIFTSQNSCLLSFKNLEERKTHRHKSSKFHIPFNLLSNQSIMKLDHDYTDHNYIIIIVICEEKE